MLGRLDARCLNVQHSALARNFASVVLVQLLLTVHLDPSFDTEEVTLPVLGEFDRHFLAELNLRAKGVAILVDLNRSLGRFILNVGDQMMHLVLGRVGVSSERPVVWRESRRSRLDPGLNKAKGLVAMVEFRVADTGTSRHELDTAPTEGFLGAHAVLMR